MTTLFLAAVAILIGVAMIFTYRTLAGDQIESQKFFGFRFGEREEAQSRVVYVIVGVGFMAWGIWLLASILSGAPIPVGGR